MKLEYLKNYVIILTVFFTKFTLAAETYQYGDLNLSAKAFIKVCIKMIESKIDEISVEGMDVLATYASLTLPEEKEEYRMSQYTELKQKLRPSRWRRNRWRYSPQTKAELMKLADKYSGKIKQLIIDVALERAVCTTWGLDASVVAVLGVGVGQQLGMCHTPLGKRFIVSVSKGTVSTGLNFGGAAEFGKTKFSIDAAKIVQTRDFAESGFREIVISSSHDSSSPSLFDTRNLAVHPARDENLRYSEVTPQFTSFGLGIVMSMQDNYRPGDNEDKLSGMLIMKVAPWTRKKSLLNWVH